MGVLTLMRSPGVDLSAPEEGVRWFFPWGRPVSSVAGSLYRDLELHQLVRERAMGVTGPECEFHPDGPGESPRTDPRAHGAPHGQVLVVMVGPHTRPSSADLRVACLDCVRSGRVSEAAGVSA